MNLLRRLFCCIKPTKSTFTIKLEWIKFPPNTFSISGYIGEIRIAEATGDYHTGKDFRLVKIDVYDNYRNKGYGSKMINQLISEARNKKCSCFVFVGVSDNNLGAIRLYQSLTAVQQDIKNCKDKHDYVLQLKQLTPKLSLN